MSANKLLTCPYDEAHKVKESRFQLHITKCRQNHLTSKTPKYTCAFNSSHVVPYPEREYHLEHCADRAPLDRYLAQRALDRNNPYKGRTAVPSYTESTPVVTDEVWDEDVNYTPGFVHAEPPPGAIIEPPPLSKPSERRRLYQELHRMPTQYDNRLPSSPCPPVNKEPKQPSQTSKLELMNRQVEEKYHNLGLGRGRGVSLSRIAANIFPSSVNSNHQPSTEMNYSAAITAGMNQLGLGRGRVENQGIPSENPFVDDENFPALGIGRGITKKPANGIKPPGGRR